MAEEKKGAEKKPWGGARNVIKADGRSWEPMDYQKMAIYVLIYNYIVQNLQDFTGLDGTGPSYKFHVDDDDTKPPIDFGLSTSALSVQIDKAIKTHFNWFVKHLNLGEAGFDLVPSTATGIDNIDKYIGEVHQIISMRDGEGLDSQYLSSDRAMINEKGMQMILRAKEEKARELFDNTRNAVEGKAGDVDPNTGKPIGGYLWKALMEAEDTKRQKLRDIAAASGNTVLKTLAAAGSIGLTTVSVMAILQAGGVAMGSFMGGVFMASPVGTAVLGLVGTVVGVKLAVKAMGSLVKSIGNVAGKCVDYFNFIHGIGDKYGVKDGNPHGYNDIVAKYEMHCEMKDLMSGFYRWAKGKSLTPIKSSDFEKLYDQYYKEKLKSYKYFNAKNWKKFYPSAEDSFGDGLKKKIRYVAQVAMENNNSPYSKINRALSTGLATELVNYNLTNPNEIYNMYTKALQDPALNLNQIKNHLKNLCDPAKKKAFEDGHATARYEELLRGYTDKILTEINDVAFNQPFSSENIQMLENSIEDKEIRERLESTYGKEGDISRIKNVVSFIKKEEAKCESFDEKQGVKGGMGTLKQQLEISHDNITEACKSMGIDPASPEYSIVDGIATRIANYSKFNETDRASLETDLAGAAGTAIENMSVDAYNYIKYIWKKKQAATLKDQPDIKKIIMNAPGYDGDERTPARERETILTVCSLLSQDEVSASNRDLSSLVNNILTISSSTPATTISGYKTMIKSKFSSYPDVVAHLEYIIDLKNSAYGAPPTEEEKKFSANYFAKLISEIKEEDINQISDKQSKVLSIRKLILNSRMSDGARQQAINMLDDRVESLIAATKQKYSRKMIDALSNSDSVLDNFNELMDKIEKISYENYSSEENADLYRTEIARSGSPAREYLQNLYMERISTTISHYIDTHKMEFQGSEGIKKLTELFTKIDNFKYLTPIIKSKLKDECSSYIEAALTSSLKTKIEAGPISNAASIVAESEIGTKRTAEGGLKDYFASSDQGDDIRKRIERTGQATFLAEMETVSAPVLPGGIKDDDSETKAIGAIYFFSDQPRGLGVDHLSDTLRNIKSLVDSKKSVLADQSKQPVNTERAADDVIDETKKMIASILETFAKDSSGHTCPEFLSGGVVDIDQIKDLVALSNGLSNINSAEDAQDMLAALLTLKRQCLGLYKTHLNGFRWAITGSPSPTQADILSHFDTEANRKLASIRNSWNELFEYIDTLCNALGGKIEVTSIITNNISSKWSYKNAQQIVNDTATYEQFSTYAQSPNL